jgi:anti-sigma B factor antagonist
MDEALSIRVRRERGYVIMVASGEIDIATVARLRGCLFELALGGRPVIADLDQVSFIDSVGVAALAGAARRAAAYGGSLHVICARPHVRRLFGMTGLDSQVPLARTLDQALQALAAARSAAASTQDAADGPVYRTRARP